MAATKGKRESRALELTPAMAALLHEALEEFIAASAGPTVYINPKDKAELRVLSKRARELSK